MIKAVVTGGIGSGKTLVCRVFECIGIPVFYADRQARKLMNNDKELKKEMIGSFGSDIYLNNGTIDRKKLADIVFHDSFALEKVNSIVHPAVRRHFNTWAEQQLSPYVLQESAIVFENNQTINFDKVITVTAPLALRIKRVIKRDNTNEEDVLARINNQLPDEFKTEGSDFVIYNDEAKMILPQILEIDKRLKEWQNLENG